MKAWGRLAPSKEDVMSLKKITGIALILALGLTVTPTVRSDQSQEERDMLLAQPALLPMTCFFEHDGRIKCMSNVDQETQLNFNRPIQLPGNIVLKPGTYSLELFES